MSDTAAEHLANALCWFGFWLAVGLSNFGEERISYKYELTEIPPTVIEQILEKFDDKE